MYASHGVPLVRSKNCHVFRDVAILMWLWWVEFSEKCCYCSAQKILNLVKEVNLTFKRGVCLNLFSRKLKFFKSEIKILISMSFLLQNVVLVSYFIMCCGISFVYVWIKKATPSTAILYLCERTYRRIETGLSLVLECEYDLSELGALT